MKHYLNIKICSRFQKAKSKLNMVGERTPSIIKSSLDFQLCSSFLRRSHTDVDPEGNRTSFCPPTHLCSPSRHLIVELFLPYYATVSSWTRTSRPVAFFLLRTPEKASNAALAKNGHESSDSELNSVADRFGLMAISTDKSSFPSILLRNRFLYNFFLKNKILESPFPGSPNRQLWKPIIFLGVAFKNQKCWEEKSVSRSPFPFYLLWINMVGLQVDGLTIWFDFCGCWVPAL